MALPRYRFEIDYSKDPHVEIIDGPAAETIAITSSIDTAEKIVKALNAYDKPAPCSACGYDQSQVVG